MSNDTLLHPISSPTNIFGSLHPGIAAIIIFAGGILIATLFRILIKKFLEALGVNLVGDRTGVSDLLRKGGVSTTPAQLIAAATSWIILIGAVLWSLQTIGVPFLAIWLNLIGKALPRILTVLGIAIVGYAVVAFIANLVTTIARNAGFAHADLLGRAIKWLGGLLIAWVAIEQLGITLRLLSAFLLILFAAVSFALALAVGLGCKDIARDRVERLLRALRERSQTSFTDLEG